MSYFKDMLLDEVSLMDDAEDMLAERSETGCIA